MGIYILPRNPYFALDPIAESFSSWRPGGLEIEKLAIKLEKYHHKTQTLSFIRIYTPMININTALADR